MLYEFELGHNVAEVAKNICCAKGESTVDHSAITRRFKKFDLGCKNLNNPARSGRPKNWATMLQKKQKIFVVQKVKVQLITVQL